jgi:acyl carrier protein
MEIKQRILEILKDINEEILTYEGKNMLADGLIDSFEIIEIISKLEDELKIEIDAENIVASNFENKETVIAMATKLASD